jgi:POT family proton-dependent oligopeptide transporter
MSSGAAALDTAELAVANYPAIEKGVPGEKLVVADADGNAIVKDEGGVVGDTVSDSTGPDVLLGPNGEQYPTKEELETLPRVVGKVGFVIYSVAFIELCERFAYYGTTAVFVNFIEQPLPPGSTTGAGGTYEQAGALNYGQQAATGLVLFNTFWSYVMPLLGGYLADTYWGRFKTINVAIVVATFGHIILIISSIPTVIANPSGALGCFVVGLVFFGIGVGFFKCNISPMIAEQYEHENPRPVIEIRHGKRVINDPVLTVSRIYMRYYFFINVGALVGQISMVYAEKYVGFWLSFTLPTILFFFCPIVMVMLRNKYHRRKPTGSVLSKSLGLLALASKGRFSVNPAQTWRNFQAADFWERVKPSKIESRPSWMTFDDAWVDEVRRGLQACKVFAFYPIFWLPYHQMSNNLVSQAATLKLDGVPNDVVNNLNPFALLILIPICDKFIYPAMEKAGIKFTPIKKIAAGFLTAALSMIVALLIQHYLYQQSPCGYAASDCDDPPPLSVWVQAPAYILIALSEIFASITGLEYAFTKAPRNMRSLVTGVFWFAQAFSAAVAQAFVPLATDPLLVWLYFTVTILTVLGGIAFWICFRELDAEEEALNALPESNFHGYRTQDVDEEAIVAEQKHQDKIREAQGLK